MNIKGISVDTITSLLALGKGSHPREFLALLKVNSETIIEDLYILPGTIGGRESAILQFDMIPLGLGHVGSAHSHPNGVISPSDADIRFFPHAGTYNIIVGYPYEKEDWACFRPDGTRMDLPVISDE